MPKPSVTTSVYQNRAQITFYSGPHKYSIDVPGIVTKMFQPSVTSVLSQKNKGQLIGWAAKESLAVVRRRLGEYQSEVGELTPIQAQELESWLTDAEENWREESNATTIGTVAHRFAYEELRFRAGLTQTKPKFPIEHDAVLMPEFTPAMLEATNASARAAMGFFDEHHLEPVLLERPLWSPQYAYVGTPDFIGRIDGELSVLDFKTSKRPYPEYFCQDAALQNAFEEEFRDQKILKRWVLVIHKDGSGIEAVVRDNSTFTEDFGMFKACLALYAWERANDNYKAGEPVRVLGNIFQQQTITSAQPETIVARHQTLVAARHQTLVPAQQEEITDDRPW
jgi:hypothetical protein